MDSRDPGHIPGLSFYPRAGRLSAPALRLATLCCRPCRKARLLNERPPVTWPDVLEQAENASKRS